MKANEDSTAISEMHDKGPKLDSEIEEEEEEEEGEERRGERIEKEREKKPGFVACVWAKGRFWATQLQGQRNL